MTRAGGGDVSVRPQDNAATVTTFQQGQIQGAWVPEPYATRLVTEGGGKVLVNEADLWPNGSVRDDRGHREQGRSSTRTPTS